MERCRRSWTSTSIPTKRFEEEVAQATAGSRSPLIEELKSKARAAGACGTCSCRERARRGPHQLEYAPLCEIMGRVEWAAEVFNCSAPDTGNMEVLSSATAREAQKQEWLEPLLAGKIRSALRHDRAARRLIGRHQHRELASSAMATATSQRPQMVGDRRPRSALQAVHLHGQDRSRNRARHTQQSMILVPRDAQGRQDRALAAGVRLRSMPRTAMPKSSFEQRAVPVANMLLGEGRGFEIAQGRLGPGPHPSLHAR